MTKWVTRPVYLQWINTLWRETMSGKAKAGRDAFTFSLGGMKTISSFTFAPAIADDRINRIRDERIKQVRSDRDPKPGGWLQSRRRTAQDCA